MRRLFTIFGVWLRLPFLCVRRGVRFGARHQEGFLQKVPVRTVSGRVEPVGRAARPPQRRGGGRHDQHAAGSRRLPDVDLLLPAAATEPSLLRSRRGAEAVPNLLHFIRQNTTLNREKLSETSTLQNHKQKEDKYDTPSLRH